MKRRIIKVINLLLSFLDLGLIDRKAEDSFVMEAALKRLIGHDFKINSAVDIGAAKGMWSLSAMKFLPQASFLAIEPLEERLKPLERVKSSYANFDFVSVVAGENDGEIVTLNVSKDLDGSTVNGKHGISRQINCRTIDSLVAEKNLKGPFLIKFDTHGFERSILNGAKKTLENTTVIVMEVYNFKITESAMRFHETCSYLEEIGFRCFDMAEPMHRHFDKAFWQMDLFFARADSKMFTYNHYE